MSFARAISIAQTDEEYDYASFSKRQTSEIYRKQIYYDYASFFKRQNDRDTPKTIREYVYCLFYKHCIAFCFYLGSQFFAELLLSVEQNINHKLAL